MTPEDHATYARLFRTAFSDAALTAIAPVAMREADGALAALATAGPAGAAPRDVLHEHVLVVLLRLFFGGLLRPEDDATVAGLARDADYANAVGRPSVRAREALRRFEGLVEARAAGYDAREDPSVWAEILRLDPAAARDRTVLGNLFIMLLAAWDSIACLVCWTVQLLGTAPAWVAEARRTPVTSGDDPFARAVLETLRLAQSEYVYREVRQPIAIDGFTVPPGWFFRLLVAESHRLDPPFDRPDVFDPDRHRDRRFAAAEFAPFGFDQHACLGARTTLVVARHFAERLVRGYTWTVIDDGPRERGNRHWNHWQPSARFRIALARHAEAAA
jgi:cytochrome P450